MVKVRWLAPGAVLALLAVAACQVIAKIEVRAYPVDGGADGATDAGTDSPVDTGTIRDSGVDTAEVACGAAPPPPPPGQTASGTIAIIGAIRSVSYTTPDAGPGTTELGFDLDCVSTCPGPPSCQGAQKNCDADAGRDLAGNYYLSAIDNFANISGEGDLNSEAAAGFFTILILIEGYNGLPDDSEVNVSLFFSGGIRPDLAVGPDAGVDADTIAPPKWDGTDVWTVDPRGVAGSVVDDAGVYHYTPTFIAPGYVTGYKVVAILPEVQVGLGVGLLTLTNGVVSAQIDAQLSGGYRLVGELAGRLSIPSILAAAAVFRDPLDPTRTQYLCGSDPTYQSFRKLLCSSADIMSDPTLDNKGNACDSVSAVLGFTAYSAKLGPEFQAISLIPGCDGGVEGCDDDQ